MITLEDVSILKPGVVDRDPILVDASATFGPRERVGILASPGSGKTTIARLLSGIDRPDEGFIESEGRVSWPIGFAGFLHPKMTVEDNLVVFAHMVGLDPDSVIEFCEDFCDLPDLTEQTMQDVTPTQRALLAYACALSVPGPAMWIADEVITVGEPHERKKCDALLEERLNEGGLVYLSRNVRLLKAYCSRFYVVINQHLVPCEDLDVAKEALDLQARNQRLLH